MKKEIMQRMPPLNPTLEPVLLQAEPESLEIDLRRTAVVVVDMQNAYCSKGGYFDLRGIDITCQRRIIEPIKEIIRVARAKGCKVVYTMNSFAPDLSDSGGLNSPNWYKVLSLVTYREHPEWKDKCVFRDTWGADIIGELRPQEGDMVVGKTRYSAFYETNLNQMLRTYDIKYLVFTGVATNACVEATLRDAYYHEYFPILVSDVACNMGPTYTQEATIYNVKMLYGWVTTIQNIMKAMQ